MADYKSIVEMKGIEKNFGAVRALRGVDLALGENEVLGIVGDNAAGKSTLMKVLSGAYIPDGGEIYIGGERAEIDGPQDSRDLGIEMVYQDFMLADNLDVAGNVFLGHEIARWKIGTLGFVLLKLPAYWQPAAVGTVIILAVMFDYWRKERSQ